MAELECCHTVLLATEQFVLASGCWGTVHSEVVVPTPVIRYKKALEVEMDTNIIIVIRLFCDF